MTTPQPSLAQFGQPATTVQAPVAAWQAPSQAVAQTSGTTARVEPPQQFVSTSAPVQVTGTIVPPGQATAQAFTTLLPTSYIQAKAISPSSQGRAGKARAGPKGLNWTPEKSKDLFGKGLIFRARAIGTNYARISSLNRLFKVSALDKINAISADVDSKVREGKIRPDQVEEAIKLYADQALRERLNLLAGSIGPQAVAALFIGPQSVHGKWPYIALSDFVLVPHIATGGDYKTVVKVLTDYATPRGSLPIGLDGPVVNLPITQIPAFVAGSGIGIWNVNLSTAGKSIRFPLDPSLTTIGQVQAATQLINFFKDRSRAAAASLNPGADDKRILAKKRNVHGWNLNSIEKIALALPYAAQTQDAETKRTYNQPWGTKLHTKGGARPQGDSSQRVIKLLESNAAKLMTFMIDTYKATVENNGGHRGTWKNIAMVREMYVPYVDANGQTVNLSTDYVGIARTKNTNAPLIANPWIGISTEDTPADIQRAISRITNLFAINSAVNVINREFKNPDGSFNQAASNQFYAAATSPQAWITKSAGFGAPSKGTRFYTRAGQLDRRGAKEAISNPRTVVQGPTSFRAS